MPIPSANLDLITEQTLQTLVGIAESETLEFKRDAYGPSDAAKRELCKDVSAMANTRGGDILIGMAESDSAAIELVGLTVNAAEEIQRMQSIVLMAVEPRIGGLQFQAVTLSGGRCAIVIRVPRSIDLPHRVTHSNVNRFYVRRTTDAFEASLSELRRMFELSADEYDRAEAFVSERIGKLLVGLEAFPMAEKENAFAALHMMPFGFHKRRSLLDLSRPGRAWETFKPIGGSGGNRLFTADGLVVHAGDPAASYGYTLVERSGALEATRSNLVRQVSPEIRAIHAVDLRTRLLRAVLAYVHDFQQFDLLGPWLVSLTIAKGNAARLMVPQGEWHADTAIGRELTEPTLTFPMALMESGADPARALRPIFDAVWQAAGLGRSD